MNLCRDSIGFVVIGAAAFLVTACSIQPPTPTESSIVGCYLWDGGSHVQVFADGTMANDGNGDHGTWQPKGSAKYVFNWNSGYRNDVVSANGRLSITTPVTPQGGVGSSFSASPTSCANFNGTQSDSCSNVVTCVYFGACTKPADCLGADAGNTACQSFATCGTGGFCCPKGGAPCNAAKDCCPGSSCNHHLCSNDPQLPAACADAGTSTGADPCGASGEWDVATPALTNGPCAGLQASKIVVKPPASVLANGGSWPDEFRPDIWSYTLDTSSCTITQHDTNNLGTDCPAPLSASVSAVFSTRAGPCHANAECTGCHDIGCTAKRIHP